MKKLFAIIAMVAACSFGATSSVMAQEDEVAATEQVDTAAVDSAVVEATDEAEAETEAAPVVEEESESIFKTLKMKMIRNF